MFKKIKISIVALIFFSFLFSTSMAFAALSCSVTTTCNSPDVVVLRMASTSNSHAELPSQSNYAELVCCTGVTGLSNSCSGTFDNVLRLSGDTNAHVEEATQSTATYDGHDACLSVPSGGTVTVGYQDTNCTGFDTTVVSMGTATTNSHLGSAGDYTRKVCATATGASSPPPPPPPSGGGGHGYPIFPTPVNTAPDTGQEITNPVDNSFSNIVYNFIPSFLKPPIVYIPPRIVISREIVPLVFQNIWNLMPEKAVNAFALAPLPFDIKTVVAKFPTLAKTFQDVGVNNISDWNKLKGLTFKLPGLTERITGLRAPNLTVEKFSLPKGIPLAKLSFASKQNMPSEFLFVRSHNELIDLDVALSLGDKGNVEQKIFTVAKESLHLVIKPDGPVKSVKGYLVFKSAAPKISEEEIMRESLAASSIFAMPAFAQAVSEEAVPVEQKLVLKEFEYTDPDGDGIYTVDIIAPVVAGEYEVITILDYVDPTLGHRQIRLTTVVDPEGYVYENNNGKQTRVPKAVVSIFRLNEVTRQYELWPGRDYQQENPQLTDVSGAYSFLVPEGIYFLAVEAADYKPYKGEVFTVSSGAGIHTNIELTSKHTWFSSMSGESFIFMIVVVLLLLNLYREQHRERLLEEEIKKYE